MDNTEKVEYTIIYFLDYGESFGGAANALLQQALLMKQAGHNIVVFFSDYFGKKMSCEYKEICSHIGIEFSWGTYQISNQTEDIDIVCIDRNYEMLRDKVKAYNPNIMHSVQINPCAELISRELKIPHIMNIYPLIPEFFSLDYMDLFPHYHLCDSWYYARKWQYYLHTDSMCIRTVVNRRTVRKTFLGGKKIKYICVGAIYKEKNQLTVIKAFHKILMQGGQGVLTICGYIEGDYGNKCIQYIKSNGLQDSIILKGFCMDMDTEYAQNDVLICGSTRESYPNAISEALANGLVIISTSVGGVPEVIKDGENGYLAKDYSEEALIEKMIQVQNDIESGYIEKLLVNVEKTFMNNHSPEAIKAQLIQYYQYVLNDYEQRKIVLENQESISINTIRNTFYTLLSCFKSNEDKFTDIYEVSRKLWYIYHAKEHIIKAYMKGIHVYIWGTGSYGRIVKEIVHTFLPEIHINGFLDSKKSGRFVGYTIYHPDEVLQKENLIIFVAAVNGQNEMIEKLDENNMIFNEDYFILSKRRW